MRNEDKTNGWVIFFIVFLSAWYVFLEISMSNWVAFLLSLSLGVTLGWSYPRLYDKYRKIKDIERELKSLFYNFAKLSFGVFIAIGFLYLANDTEEFIDIVLYLTVFSISLFGITLAAGLVGRNNDRTHTKFEVSLLENSNIFLLSAFSFMMTMASLNLINLVKTRFPGFEFLPGIFFFFGLIIFGFAFFDLLKELNDYIALLEDGGR